MILVAGSQIHLPSSPIQLADGAGGTNPSGGIASAGGGAGLLDLEGTLSLGVTSASSFDQLQVNGMLDGPDAVTFSFTNDTIANAFSSTFTFDSFFPDAYFPALKGLDFSATSPTRSFDVTLPIPTARSP